MSVHALLSKIQKELKAPKNQTNKFGGYKYRSCEDILEGVKPLLGEGHLTLSDKIEMIGDRFYVVALATLSLGDDKIHATGYAREAEDKKGMDSSQITGAASSYARKYALNGLFCIDDTKDADSNEHQQMKQSQSKQASQIKMLSDDEVNMLNDGIDKAQTMDDLKLAWSNVNAARKRMSDEQFAMYEKAKDMKKEALNVK